MERHPSSFSLFCLSFTVNLTHSLSSPFSPPFFDVVCLLGGCSSIKKKKEERIKRKKGGKKYERTGLTLSYSEGKKTGEQIEGKKKRTIGHYPCQSFLLPFYTTYVCILWFMYILVFVCFLSFPDRHSTTTKREKKSLND